MISIRGTRIISALTAAALLCASQAAWADIGQPTGAGPGNTFSLHVTRNGVDIVNNPAVPFPTDLQPTFVDGDPEDYVVVGSLGPNQPIILKIVSDGGATVPFRTMHWYLDAPFQDPITHVIDVNTPGPTSLFDTSTDALINVDVGNIKFVSTSTATPLLVNNNSFYTSYMLTPGVNVSEYYQTPHTNGYNAFGNGNVDVQVPGQWYLDGDASAYTFGATSGPVVSWNWDKIVLARSSGNLALNTNYMDNFGNSTEGNGKIFELGLGIAAQGLLIPEPSTMVLASAGILSLFRRRRQAR